MRHSLLIAMISFWLTFASLTGLADDGISAVGSGNTEEEAKENALSSLAYSIFVSIESQTESLESYSGDNSFSIYTKTSSDIPIIGSAISCTKIKKVHECVASLSKSKSIAKYKNYVLDAVANINSLHNKAQKSATRKHELLNQLLVEFDVYEKYSTVFLYLGGRRSESIHPKINRSAVIQELAELEEKPESLASAARSIAKNITGTDIYVYPATTQNSKEFTPFAIALKQHLDKALSAQSSPENARRILQGEYLIGSSSIQVAYREVEKHSGNTLSYKVVELRDSSYKQYDFKPKTFDLDQLFFKGYAVSSDLKIELSTNYGSRNLVFYDGDELELFVKVNRPGYYYLVGHTTSDKGEMSYLVEMNEAQGDRKFISYINADDVNKLVSVGRFEVTKPFGLERLQAFVSEADLVGKLPDYQYDPVAEQYIFSRDIKKGVLTSRALKKIKASKEEKNKVSRSEAVLQYTTIAKSL